MESCEYNYNTKNWDYFIIDLNAKKHLIQKEFRTSPFIEMAWSLTAGETYGRGPGLKAVPDFMTLNKLKEYSLRSLAFLTPFFVVKAGENYKNWIIKPGAMLPVSQNPREDPAMTQMGITQQADITQFNIEALEMSIKKIMFNLDVPNSRDITATEYQDRKNELIKQVMNSYGRLVSMQKQIIKRCIEVLQLQGRFPADFDVRMFDGMGAKIKMKTVLAGGQKLDEVKEKTQALQTLLSLDQTGALLNRFIKTDTLYPKLLRDIGLSSDDVRNEEELELYDFQASQMMALQKQTEENL